MGLSGGSGLVRDRIFWMAILILFSFLAVLLLPSQSAASYPTYILTIGMLVTIRQWEDVMQVDLFRWVCLLVGWLSASAMWSSPFEVRETASVLLRGVLVIAFVVAFAECQLRSQLQRWMGLAFAVIGSIVTVVAITLFFLTVPDDGRLNGLGQLDTHVIAALVYGVLLIFVVQRMLVTSSLLVSVLFFLMALVMGVAVFLSDSRNAWLSVPIGLLAFLLAHFVRERGRIQGVLATGLTLGAALIVIILNDEQLTAILLPRGDSFRLGIWTEFLMQIAESPIVGLGITTNDDVLMGEHVIQHPHSMYLSVLFQGGLIGLTLYLIVLFKVVKELLAHIHTEADAQLGIGILMLAMVAYMIDGHELIDKVGSTWFLLWLPVAIAIGLQWRRSLRVKA